MGRCLACGPLCGLDSAVAKRLQTCPKCRALITPGTKRCPYCEADQRGVLAPSPEADARSTYRLGLVAISLFLFIYLAMNALDPVGDSENGLGQPSAAAMRMFGLCDRFLVRDCGHWWRIVTAMFVHLDLMHLVFNSVALFILAPIAAAVFGSHRTTAIYLGSGILAGLISHHAGNSWGGASGAISGLIGASAVYGHRRGNPQLRQQMIVWMVIIFVWGVLAGSSEALPRVDQVGHLAGMAVGAAMGWFASAVYAPGGRVAHAWRNGAWAGIALVGAIAVAFWLPNVVRGTAYRDVIRYRLEADRVLRITGNALRAEDKPGRTDRAAVEDAPGGADELRASLLALVDAAAKRPRSDATRDAWDAADRAFRVWQKTLKCRYAIQPKLER